MMTRCMQAAGGSIVSGADSDPTCTRLKDIRARGATGKQDELEGDADEMVKIRVIWREMRMQK